MQSTEIPHAEIVTKIEAKIFAEKRAKDMASLVQVMFKISDDKTRTIIAEYIHWQLISKVYVDKKTKSENPSARRGSFYMFSKLEEFSVTYPEFVTSQMEFVSLLNNNLLDVKEYEKVATSIHSLVENASSIFCQHSEEKTQTSEDGKEEDENTQSSKLTG